MNNKFFYFFIIAVVALGLGFLLFGSGYDFDQHRLKGERQDKKKNSAMVSDYIYPIRIETKLKDSFLKMDFNVAVETPKGIREIKRKIKRVKYGITLVLSHYKKKQVHKRKLERSTLKKLIQSQIKDKVLGVQIVKFEKS